MTASGLGLKFASSGLTWVPKVCRIMAFYRYWAIILLLLGGSGLRGREDGFRVWRLMPYRVQAEAFGEPDPKP